MINISARVVKRKYRIKKGGSGFGFAPTWYVKGKIQGRSIFKSLDIPIGQTPTETRRSLREAQAAVETIKSDARRANFGWLVEDRTTFTMVADLYVEEHVKTACRPKSRSHALYRIRKLKEFFGPMKLNAINELAVTRWRRQGGAPSVLNRHFNDLRAILNFAVARKFISESLIKGVKPIRTQFDPRDPRIKLVNAGDGRREIIVNNLTETAIYRELSEADQHLLEFTYLTACRRDEPLTLLFEDEVVEQGQRFLILRAGGNKTGKEVRKPVTPRMAEILKRMLHRTGFIFSTDGGKTPLSSEGWRLRFRRATTRAKDQPDFFHFAVKDLRRSRATHLADAGVPLREIQLLLGHANLEMTEHYLKRTERSLDLLVEASKKLDKSQKRGSNGGAMAFSSSARMGRNS